MKKKKKSFDFIQLMCLKEEEMNLKGNQSRKTVKDFNSWPGFYLPTLDQIFQTVNNHQKSSSAGTAGGDPRTRHV